MSFLRLKSLGLCVALSATMGSVFGADVGVSVAISQPGVYGRIDIGRVAVAPVLVYAQPVVVAGPVARVQRPIYLYVPPGHQKHWAKHCAQYGACNQPVYFVQESWVRGYDDRSHGQQKKHKKHKKNDD